MEQTTLDTWLDRQIQLITKADEERAESEAHTAHLKRLGEIDECNKLLAKWGLPIGIYENDEQFPYLTIGNHLFCFVPYRFISDYSRREHLRHVVMVGDDHNIDPSEINSPIELARWLTGECQHQPIPNVPCNSDEEEAEDRAQAALSVPDTYRVLYEDSPRALQSWLNAQAADGFYPLLMSSDVIDGNSSVWIVTQRSNIDFDIVESQGT